MSPRSRVTRLLLSCALWVAVCPVVRAEEPVPEEAPKVPVLTKAPVLTRFVEAPYPPDMEAAQAEGAVVLLVTIGADGKVLDAVIQEGATPSFDAAAIEAVKQFEFEPAELDGKPGAIQLLYRYRFTYRAPALEKPGASAAEPRERATPAGAPKPLSISGRLLERGTRVPLPNHVVLATSGDTSVEATTDPSGAFEFRGLAPAEWRLTFNLAGFERYETTETVRANEVVDGVYYVRRLGNGFSATVRTKREKKDVSRRSITLEEISKIPGTNGDAIKVVQNLPGVARTPLSLGPPVVRGGRIGDTRTYVDGQLVPLLFHFGGLVAVLNSDFLESLDFYSGNPPVRFGRSVAGAIDVQTREGRADRHRGYVDVNITQATAFLEGPIVNPFEPKNPDAKPIGTFMASVRRSYFELALPIVFAILGYGDQVDFRVAPRFWDYQLKADFDLGADQLGFFVFGSDDELEFLLTNPALVTANGAGDFSTRIGFHRAGASWKRKLAPDLDHRLALTLGSDRTTYALGGDFNADLRLDIAALREDLTWKPAEWLSVNAGADFLFAPFFYGLTSPPLPAPGEFLDPGLTRPIRSEDGGFTFEPALFADVTWSPVPNLRVVPGVRVDGETFMRRVWVDPRVAAFWEVVPGVSLKGSAGRSHQPPLPNKLTKKFGNPALVEEGSTQVAGGVEWALPWKLELDLQGYWKHLYQEAVRSGATVTEADGTTRRLNYESTGEGLAYGVELLLRKPPGEGIFGWIALSVGDAVRRASPTEPWITSTLVQRYNLVVVASYKFPYDIDGGVRLRWTEGNPATPLQGGIYFSDSDAYLPIPSAATRSIRRPDFFQLDVRIDRRWVFDTWILDAYLDIQNVTNRANVEGTNPNYDFTREVPFTGIPILPTFGVRGEF